MYMVKFVGRYFYWFFTIFAIKKRLFLTKNWREKKCQNPFLVILRLKKEEEKSSVCHIKLGEDYFLRLPLTIHFSEYHNLIDLTHEIINHNSFQY